VIGIAGFLKGGGSFGKLLEVVYTSTGTSEYNYLAAIPLVPFQFLGMESRVAFIGAICLLYGGGLYLVCAWIFKIHANATPPLLAPVISATLLATTGGLWYPAMRGYVDLIALVSALFSLGLCVRAEKSESPRLLYLFAGMCVAASPLLRRYFAFYLVLFCVLFASVALWEVIGLLRRGKFFWSLIKTKIWLLFGILLIFALFPKFVAYSFAFKKGITAGYLSELPYWGQVWSIVTHFGAVPVLVYVLGILLILRDGIAKRATLLSASIASLAAFLWFLRWQYPGEHHLYILAIAYFSTIAAASGIAIARRSQALHVIYMGVLALGVIGGFFDILTSRAEGSSSLNALAHLAGPQRHPAWRVFLFGSAAPRPIVRNDAAEIQRLLSKLDRVCGGDPTARIYFLASSSILSDATVSAGLLPSPGLKFASGQKLLQTHHVDSRDGVPNNLLAATHVVTTFPVELHLKPDSQKCVTVAWEQFKDGRGFAKAFERMSDEFVLADGSKAVIFWRVHPSTREEVMELEKDLRVSGLLE
jgi:hypothetical protein